MASPLHLAVALDGMGWHPAAWRDPAARPKELFTGGYWADLVLEAERGLLDFVTFEDAFGLQSTRFDGPDGRADLVRGRLDAVLIASRAAPLTSRVGLVPTTSTTHTEPFHVATAIASLDHISAGRAGWRPQGSGRRSDARHFGRREFAELTLERIQDPDFEGNMRAVFDEAGDHVEVVRRLWDSWEDDAVIRDTATGRFVDRDKLHYVDFEGPEFSVRGPLITPRPPQGQPVVTALAHSRISFEFAAQGADIVYITPHHADQARSIAAEVRGIERTGEPLKIFAELVVFLAGTVHAAAERKARLDELDGAEYTSDALVFVGTPAQLADLLVAWGLDGYRLRPGVLPYDLEQITRGLVPELQRRGAFRTGYEAATLRGLLGLPHPANRYAAGGRLR